MRPVLSALCLLALSACGSTQGDFVQQRFYAMGTWVDLQFEARNNAADSELLESIEVLLSAFEKDYYAWSDGELARINAGLANGMAVEAGEDMIALLRQAQRIARLSQGHFEPGVAELVELWGFHSSLADPQIPTDASVQQWRRTHLGIAALHIEDSRISLQVPTSAAEGELGIDLGGIAKGEAVDRILALIRRSGIDNALVDAGGDVRALGRRGDRPWRVGIQSPRSNALLGDVELQDGEAVFTSGDYERYLDGEDGRMHHLLDPATGRPAMHTQAVTVIGESGVLADAAATALFVAGRDQWREIAAALGIRFVLRVDASGEIEMTPAMNRRLSGNETTE